MAAAEAEVASPPIADAASDATETATVVVARTSSPAQVSKAALAAKLLSLSGVFAVHKPKGPTSAELLNRLKEKLLAGTAARVGTRLRRSPLLGKRPGVLNFILVFVYIYLPSDLIFALTALERKRATAELTFSGQKPGQPGLNLKSSDSYNSGHVSSREVCVCRLGPTLHTQLSTHVQPNSVVRSLPGFLFGSCG